MARVQAIGVVRFSYLCEGGFQTKHESLAARRAFLFQPARIEERFALFEHVTLPAIRAQTDPDFVLIVLISVDMPSTYLNRLADLLEDIPQVALVPMEPMNMVQATKVAVARFKNTSADAIAHFRLDDDDAIAVDFIETVRSNFAKDQNIFEQIGRLALDFQNGFALSVIADEVQIERVTEPLWTPGLVVFLRPKSTGNALTFSHLHLAKHMQVITDHTPLMFIRCVNGFNDSTRWISRLDLSSSSDIIRRQLSSRFSVTPKALLANWPQ